MPQAVSERLFTKFAFREVLERAAGHVVMLDIVWTGGITEAIKIATLADTYHLGVAPHDCSGPINVFAALHLCAAVSNATIMETVRGFCEGYYLELLDRPVPIREGRAHCELGRGSGRTASSRAPGPARPEPPRLQRLKPPGGDAMRTSRLSNEANDATGWKSGGRDRLGAGNRLGNCRPPGARGRPW